MPSSYLARSVSVLSVCSSIAVAFSAQAVAQDAVTSSDLQVFAPDYFVRFSPATADDMVRQLPGFAMEEGDSVRGFGGAAGNVLINGERPSTKTSLRTLLGRIPAANVARIEIATGASADLDMRGQTKVANVVLNTGMSGTSGAWQVTGRHFRGGRLNASAEASANMPAFGGTLNLSLEAGAPGGGGPGGGVRSQARRGYYDGTGNLFEQHVGSVRNERETLEPAFAFKRSLGWGKMNLNGSYSSFENDGSSFYEIHSPTFEGPITRLESQKNAFERDSYSLNGDLELPLGDATAKLIVLYQRASGTGDNLYGFFDGAGDFNSSVRVQSEDSSGESIARGQISWPLGDSHTIEVSLEGAYNFLDSTRWLTLDTGADVTPPGSDTIVEEYRGEFQVSDVWQVAPELTLEPGMKFEYSQIKQEGRLSSGGSIFAEREFTYPKPGVTATWRPTGTQQVRVSLERTVAQLDFKNFVSAVEVINDQVTGGNADLVPQKAWAFNAEFEQKFWGDGVLTLVGSFAKVNDVEDQVPVVPLGGSILQAFDGPGNIGDGEQWSLGIRASVPLDRIGIADGRLELSMNDGDSEVVDPVTGRVREFSNSFNNNWNVSFRQDVPEHGFSYGFSFGGGGSATSYRLTETFTRQRTAGDLQLFVETNRIAGLKVRVGWNDIFDPAFVSQRSVYDAPRSTGDLILFQRNESRNGPFGFVRVSGTF